MKVALWEQAVYLLPVNLGVQVLSIQQIPGRSVQGQGFPKDFFLCVCVCQDRFLCAVLAVLELTL